MWPMFFHQHTHVHNTIWGWTLTVKVKTKWTISWTLANTSLVHRRVYYLNSELYTNKPTGFRKLKNGQNHGPAALWEHPSRTVLPHGATTLFVTTFPWPPSMTFPWPPPFFNFSHEQPDLWFPIEKAWPNTDFYCKNLKIPIELHKCGCC